MTPGQTSNRALSAIHGRGIFPHTQQQGLAISPSTPMHISICISENRVALITLSTLSVKSVWWLPEIADQRDGLPLSALGSTTRGCACETRPPASRIYEPWMRGQPHIHLGKQLPITSVF
jgi:hypothetical protein